MVRIDETAYKNYVKYVIPKAFHHNKYNRKKISTNKNSELDCFYDSSIAKYYENQKSHIEDTKNNLVITSLSLEKFKEILQEAYSLIIIKLRKLLFKTMRIFVIMEFEVIYMKNKKIEIGTNKYNLGRVDVSSLQAFREYFFYESIHNFHLMNRDGYSFVDKVGDIAFNVLKYDPLNGASYTPIPDFIKNTNSIINIKNKDEKCFLWCCIASRHLPERDCERVKQYEQYKNQFIYDEIDMPMKIIKIMKFEKSNNVNINVYTSEDKDTKYPIHISKQQNKEVINLFYYNNHYSLIKNFSRFCGTSHKYNCPNCLKSYSNTDCYKKHVLLCQDLNENGSHIKMPLKDTFTSFTDYAKKKKMPVVMYSDFESSLENYNDDKKKYIVAKHVSNSYRLIIKTELDLGIPLEYDYVGKDTDIHFVKLLCDLDIKITTKLRELNKIHEKPILNEAEKISYSENNHCILCNKNIPYNPKNYKVRDHCHFTGKYLGPAHQCCNLKSNQLFRGNSKIPLFFHNANYDIKCFINAFRTLNPTDYIKKISGVPCNMDIYKSLNINNICIMDSYAHLTSSLSSLIKNLPDDKKTTLRKITNDNEKFQLINEKGFYLYEFVDCIEKLDTPINQIKREHFDSKLMLSKLTDTEWVHIQNVVEKFDIKTLREWHDLYLKIDVYGLADVFEYYRNLSMDNYGLDPAHFLGLPGFTWSAGLKFTQVKLQNIYDSDLYMFFEKMKRGGISVISTRYSKANNKYLPDYDETKEISYNYQQDCNNLYGYSMCQNLPVDEIDWCNNFNENIIQDYKSSDPIGYVLEVDLDYPEHLHDEHNDYPLAPEHLTINKHKKLCPNLQDKKNYILHIDNLQYYLNKGLILKKIHKVVKFNQSSWLKPYIDMNSKKRQEAKNDFEKDYYKLLNNAFYGKTMENVRDRVNVQFCTNEKEFIKHTNSPLFANQINIMKKDGLILVKKHKKTVELNICIYIGACILESSKLHMFKFHYDVMKVSFPNALMMKTDTDSLCYRILTNDLYDDLKNNDLIQKHMEFSNYPKDHPLYNCDRKKVPGLFQDECVDGKMAVISEYIGLRAKSYSNNLFYPSSEIYQAKKKSKGVPSSFKSC